MKKYRNIFCSINQNISEKGGDLGKDGINM
jgi:hypothetical protein